MLHFICFSYPFYTDNILSICLPITTFIYFSYPFYAVDKLLIYVPVPFVCCSMCLFLCFQCIESRVTSWHKLSRGKLMDRDVPRRYLKKNRGTNKYFFFFHSFILGIHCHNRWRALTNTDVSTGTEFQHCFWY